MHTPTPKRTNAAGSVDGRHEASLIRRSGAMHQRDLVIQTDSPDNVDNTHRESQVFFVHSAFFVGGNGKQSTGGPPKHPNVCHG